ncbi:midkine (neurite growth-promoting factor 2), partial [Chelydra serpentina]
PAPPLPGAGPVSLPPGLVMGFKAAGLGLGAGRGQTGAVSSFPKPRQPRGRICRWRAAAFVAGPGSPRRGRSLRSLGYNHLLLSAGATSGAAALREVVSTCDQLKLVLKTQREGAEERGSEERVTPGRRAETEHRSRAQRPAKMQVRGLFLILVLILMAAASEAGKNKKDKVKKNGSECEDWRWGPCTPNSKDCGVGYREGTCKEETKRLKCKIPCNWKKEFGADCKYKFESWGGCDAATGLKARSGTLKKALYNAECQETIQVTKPCSPKTKSKSKARKGKGKD